MWEKQSRYEYNVQVINDEEKVLKSPNYPNQYPTNYQNTITMDVQQPPMTIEFTNFNTEDGYDKGMNNEWRKHVSIGGGVYREYPQ